MERRNSLIGQVLAVNVLLVTAALFAASVAARLDLAVRDERLQFTLLALAILLALCANILMLRRRFTPLERLIEQLEAIDPAQPSGFEAPAEGTDEVRRLVATFQRLLDRVEGERRRSGRLVLRAQEEERKRLARDLHDEVNQALTAILLRLQALTGIATTPEQQEEVAELKRLVNQAMDELLSLARQLRPTALDDHGLVPALEGQVRRFGEQTGIRARLTTRGDTAMLGDDQQLVVYRVAQEALSNVARHSGASAVHVDISARDGGVHLRVSDDGRGFEAGPRARGLGLEGMAERARLVGGELSVDSAPGQGTTVTLRVP
ncbi:MAG: sensor histidine kinase [Thermoleophilaceae bacterium]|nr:sensor histidine kinase [Thermoleophilaceae bacterium]